MGILRAERHIVAHHQDGDTLRRQLPKNVGKGHLKLRIETFGGLVQQQNIGARQQHFRQRCTLLLTARDVVGMAVEELTKGAQLRNAGYFRILPFLVHLLAAEHLI